MTIDQWSGKTFCHESSRSLYFRQLLAASAEGVLFDDLDFGYQYKDRLAYGHSGLAKLFFSLRLPESLWGTRITCNSQHPRIVDIEIGRHFNLFMPFGMKLLQIFAQVTAAYRVEQKAPTRENRLDSRGS